MTPLRPHVIIYTDGACDPNPGPGGWAAVLRFGAHEKVLTGAAPHATNNRMELHAVIAALTALKQPCTVTLYTDSEYVRAGVTAALARWQDNGWRTTTGEPVANRDLWEALAARLPIHQIDWQWVKGHAGDEQNERVDRLAASMLPRLALPLDDERVTHLFTGVSCVGTRGAWAAIIRSGAEVREVSGAAEPTSANRLHLLAIEHGLKATPPDRPVNVYTPSDYAANGAKSWLNTWQHQQWRTRQGQPVKHADVWQAIAALSQRREVHWFCLKDQTRPAEAQRAEALAQQARR